MNLAFVVQRYGKEIIGGAEHLARQIAEQITAHHHNVTIYTTTAQSYRSWENAYPQTSSYENGVLVKRFHSKIKRHPALFSLIHGILKIYLKLVPFFGSFKAFEKLWLILQGPYCPNLVLDLKQNAKNYDRIVFFTYLYYPTVVGLHQIQHSHIILVPSAHDEPAIYLPFIQKAMNLAHQIFYNTEEESYILEKIIENFKQKSLQVGIGINFEKQKGKENNFSHQLPSRPFLLYLGRLTRAKGLELLFSGYLAFTELFNEKPPLLVLAGELEKDLLLPENENIIFLNKVTEDLKEQLLEKCLFLVHPSAFESLSLSLLEAIYFQKPALLNQACNVFCGFNARLPKSLFLFKDEKDFAKKAFYLLETINKKDLDLQEALKNAKIWLQKTYSWQNVLHAYLAVGN